MRKEGRKGRGGKEVKVDLLKGKGRKIIGKLKKREVRERARRKWTVGKGKSEEGKEMKTC